MTTDHWRPKLTQVEDPIADDHWEYVTPQGQRRTARLTVGRPVHHPPARAWYCPISIEGHTPRVDAVFGEGPVDALMNAMGVVRTFFDHNFHIVPGVRPRRPARKRGSTVKRPQQKTAKAKTSGRKPPKTSRKRTQGS